MKNEEIMKRLNAVFADVFDDDTIVIEEKTTADDIEGWDSLTHINLLCSVEEEFGIQFDMKSVQSLKNVGEMAELIASKLK